MKKMLSVSHNLIRKKAVLTMIGTAGVIICLIGGLFLSRIGSSACVTERNVIITITVTNPPPTITSVVPNIGKKAGGTNIVITGTRFMGGMTVAIGTIPCTGVVVVNSTTINAVTGVSPAAGTLNVVVTRFDGATGTLVNGFTYTTGLVIDRVTPRSSMPGGGVLVSVEGNEFVCGGTVKIGANEYSGAEITCLSPTTLKMIVKPDTVGAKDVVVTNPGGDSATLVNGFVYSGITITSINPLSGACGGGTKVEITGNSFVQGDTVYFGERTAKYAVVTGNSIVAYTAAHLEGRVQVKVDDPLGAEATYNYFVYCKPVIQEVRWKKLKDRISTTLRGRYFGVKDESALILEAIVAEYAAAPKQLSSSAKVLNPSVGKWEDGELLLDVPIDVLEGDIVIKVLGVEMARKHVIFQAAPANDLSNVKVYPNPFRIKGPDAAVNSELKFINLTSTSQLRIYNLNAELVRDIGPEQLKTLYGNEAYGVVWDGKNDRGDEVASGLYFYLITDDNGNKTKGKMLVLK